VGRKGPEDPVSVKVVDGPIPSIERTSWRPSTPVRAAGLEKMALASLTPAACPA
jgi:hypothetical protein